MPGSGTDRDNQRLERSLGFQHREMRRLIRGNGLADRGLIHGDSESSQAVPNVCTSKGPWTFAASESTGVPGCTDLVDPALGGECPLDRVAH